MRINLPTHSAKRVGLASAIVGLIGAVLIIGDPLGIVGSLTKGKEPLPDSLPLLLGEATKANFTHDLERELGALQKAEKLDGEPEDVAEVQRRLAVIDWKYHALFAKARSRLLHATEGPEPYRAWLALARMEQAGRRFEAARSAAEEARDLAKSTLEIDEAQLAIGRASVEEAVMERLAGNQGASAALRESFAELREMVEREPGYLEPSRLLLRSALILEDGPSALLAWRSYFHVTPDEPGPNLVARAGRELDRLLSRWQGDHATAKARIRLIEALADSRLYTEAALIGLAPSTPEDVRQDLDVRVVISYAHFIREVREQTDEYYRETLLGIGSRGEWQTSLSSAAEPLVILLNESAFETATRPTAPRVDSRRVGSLGKHFIELLNQHFGAYVSVGTTAGYFDLHMGHRVLDETRTVEQYGRSVRLRFIALDNMVSNGFQSWAWENAEHGGWNKPEAIYQVRPRYVEGGLRIWRLLHSDEELAEKLKEMERESALDEERAERDPYAYLPGLAMRLEYQGQTALLERLTTDHREGPSLKLAFLAAYDRAVQESSIFAHEGRHAIDKRDARLPFGFARNSEFTAKLAEVAFASEPRMALGAIISPSIGDRTSHGKANLEIMKGLVDWMGGHSKEIVGLDSGRPLLPQLDLLTDEQLRAAFRSMDRLANSE